MWVAPGVPNLVIAGNTTIQASRKDVSLLDLKHEIALDPPVKTGRRSLPRKIQLVYNLRVYKRNMHGLFLPPPKPPPSDESRPTVIVFITS